MPYWTVFLILAVPIMILAFLNGAFDLFGDSPQFSFTLLGSFAMYLATRPHLREIGITVCIGLVLFEVYTMVATISPYFGAYFISSAGFVGLASLFVLGCNSIRAQQYAAFVAAAFFPFFAIVLGFVLPVTNGLSPNTFDTHLLAVDGSLGFQASFLLGRLVATYPLLWNLTATLYYALPLPVAILCANAQKAGNTAETRRLLCLFGVTSFAGFCLYTLCPATGPKYAFPGWFPLNAPALADIQVQALSVAGAPRNAMPSLHFSAALLIFWGTENLRIAGRIAAGLFLGGTAIATLALGEHYLVDLIIAVPFSLTCFAAFTSANPKNRKWRYCVMAGSAGAVAAWLVVLRFGVLPLIKWPLTTFLLLTLTVLGSFLAKRTLCTSASTSQLMGARPCEPGEYASASVEH